MRRKMMTMKTTGRVRGGTRWALHLPLLRITSCLCSGEEEEEDDDDDVEGGTKRPAEDDEDDEDEVKLPCSWAWKPT